MKAENTPFILSIKAKEEFRRSPETAVTSCVMKRQMCGFISVLVAVLLLSVFLWDYINQVISTRHQEFVELHISTAVTLICDVLVMHIYIQIYTYIYRERDVCCW